MTVRRLPIVGVMGSGVEAHGAQAQPLGRWLARCGVHLLTGGGGGVMASVSAAFAGVEDRRGLVIGIVPAGPETGEWAPRVGYPNPWVELPIFTHLPRVGAQGAEPLSRNHINVLSSDVIVALPGGAGTASEMELAVRYGRPAIAWFADAQAIGDCPRDIPVERELDAVCRFITYALDRIGT